MSNHSTSLLNSAEMPHGLTAPQQALWWLRKSGLGMGPEWQRAHELCQRDEGDYSHDAVHALAHWIEGDTANAAYWYRRTGEVRAASIEAEWERLANKLMG